MRTFGERADVRAVLCNAYICFSIVFEDAVSVGVCKGLRPNAVGPLGISPLVKVVVALRQLACAIPSNLCGDLFDISKSTAARCSKAFASPLFAALTQNTCVRQVRTALLVLRVNFAVACKSSVRGAVQQLRQNQCTYDHCHTQDAQTREHAPCMQTRSPGTSITSLCPPPPVYVSMEAV